MPDNNRDKYFLASIVETSNDSIITIDLDLEITSWNKAAEELYGYSASEAIGNKLTTLTLPKDFHKLLEKIERIKQSKEIEVFESERVGKDKAHMILEVVVSPVKDQDGSIIGVSTIARDLTARRLSEKAMHDKDVLHRLVIAQEDERSRISRDLHDDLGQELTALGFALARAKDACKDEDTSECIDSIMEIAKRIDSSLEFLAWELRPALLEGVGLAAAIKNYLPQWSRHANVEVELRIAGLETTQIAPNIETNLYRIFQESLNNIYKHAKARSVDVTLERRDGSIVLIVSDDGAGFSLRSKKKQAHGLGLTGMRERSSLIGGTLELESAPGRGTTVHVRLEVKPAKKRRSIRASAATNWAESAPASKPPPIPTQKGHANAN